MFLKDNVRFKDCKQAILIATMVAQSVYESHGYEFIITSWNDSNHMAKSLHYSDCAFDCRTRHLKEGDAKKIRDEIDSALPSGFDVVLEKDHIHIEADLK